MVLDKKLLQFISVLVHKQECMTFVYFGIHESSLSVWNFTSNTSMDRFDCGTKAWHCFRIVDLTGVAAGPSSIVLVLSDASDFDDSFCSLGLR